MAHVQTAGSAVLTPPVSSYQVSFGDKDYLKISSNGICVSTFIFGCLPVPQTGKHPNMNVETQIPLELSKDLLLYTNLLDKISNTRVILST